ncbi:MAG: rhomboid family intramembrane serine protease [Peptococcaceae bacterium]|nr:rhomboid family intramembrane serine protease [Peptococcaceae bacterium]
MNYYKKDFKEYYITYSLICVNLIIFLIMTLLGGSTKITNLIIFGAKVNPLIEAGQYWRLVTSIFIHIGFTHLLFNTYALYVLGKLVEKMYGHGKFLLIYIFSGITGALFSFIFSTKISAGASGAIFGLLGSILVYGWRKKIFWRSGLITNLLIILGINMVFGIIAPGIDNFAHFGGFLGGITVSYILRLIALK